MTDQNDSACAGLTSDGRPCGNKRQPRQQFCGLHLPKRKRRTRGTGSVERYTTKDGPRYRAEVNLGTASAPVVERQFGFTTMKAADLWLASTRLAHARGEHVSRSALTVSDVAAQWLASKRADAGVRSTSVDNYAMTLRSMVLPYLGDRHVQSVTATDLDALWVTLRTSGRKAGGGLAQSSVSYAAGILGSVFSFAARRRLLARSPFDDLDRRPTPSPPNPTGWTPQQVRTFLDGTAHTRYAALWTLYATTGARRGEGLGLAWTDLTLPQSGSGSATFTRALQRWSDGAPVFAPPKTGRSRRIGLTPETVASLVRWREQQDLEAAVSGAETGGLVFTRADGRAYNPEVVTHAFRGEVARLGLPPLRLHNLRHSHVAALAAAGVSVGEISRRLGHARASTTLDVYGHVLPSQDERAVAALSDLGF
jgi:integrase